MKSPLLPVLIALAVTITAFGQDQIQGWGIALNPAKDCEFQATNGILTITVPGSSEPHDMSAELGSTTAPHVVRPVKGDFIVQVRVDGDFAPGDDSTQGGRTGYTGAGLVAIADGRNYIRHERATLHGEGDEPHPYTNFEIRVDGELERGGTTGDLPTENDKPTWLRLERRGQQLLGSMSQDGVNWTSGEPKELRSAAWNKDEILVGVAAISTSRKPFTPRYSEFSLQQGGKAITADPLGIGHTTATLGVKMPQTESEKQPLGASSLEQKFQEVDASLALEQYRELMRSALQLELSSTRLADDQRSKIRHEVDELRFRAEEIRAQAIKRALATPTAGGK